MKKNQQESKRFKTHSQLDLIPTTIEYTVDPCMGQRYGGWGAVKNPRVT